MSRKRRVSGHRFCYILVRSDVRRLTVRTVFGRAASPLREEQRPASPRKGWCECLIPADAEAARDAVAGSSGRRSARGGRRGRDVHGRRCKTEPLAISPGFARRAAGWPDMFVPRHAAKSAMSRGETIGVACAPWAACAGAQAAAHRLLAGAPAAMGKEAKWRPDNCASTSGPGSTESSGWAGPSLLSFGNVPPAGARSPCAGEALRIDFRFCVVSSPVFLGRTQLDAERRMAR